MRGKIWLALVLIVAATVVVAVVAVQGVSSRVGGGSDGLRALETRLRATFREIAAEEPPLRVFSMVPEKEGGGWRWKVEATLAPGRTPDGPEAARILERATLLCLRPEPGRKAPGGVLYVLHRPGMPDWTRTVDGEGKVR